MEANDIVDMGAGINTIFGGGGNDLIRVSGTSATVGRTQEALVEAREDFLRDCAMRRDELLARLVAHPG